MDCNKQLRRFAFTLNGENVEERIEEVKELLAKNTVRWVFQLEKGDEKGRLHLQGRFSVHPARRLRELKIIPGAHYSIEHDEENSTFYCMKGGSVGGPWGDKDVCPPIPWDLAKITEWKPWQLSIFQSLDIHDDRIINILIDKHGGIGKSKVYKYALWKDWAGVIPAIGDAKDIVQGCCSMGAKKAYILDLPRCGEDERHMNSIWKAIEMIKNGIVMDYRNKFKKIIMGSPVIWVFTNHKPDKKRLSSDRWKLWTVESDELRPL